MAITSRQIIDFLLANPSMSDADIATAMQTYNVTSAQMAAAVGVPVADVQARYKLAAPSVYTAENVNKLADQILSQGTTEAWTGGLPPATAARYMADELAQSGVTDITQVAKGETGIINVMTGDKLISGYGERTKDNLWSGSYEGKGNTGFGVNFDESGKPVFYTQGASSSTLKNDVLKLAAVAAVAFGIPGVSEGLLTGAGTTGLTLAELSGTAGAGALTAAETAALYGAGGSLTAGLTVADIAALEAGLPSGVGSLTAGLTAAQIAAGEAALPGLTAAELATLTSGGLLSTAGGSLTAGLTPTQIAAAEAGLPTTTGLLSSTIPAAAATIPAAAAATTAATALTPTATNIATSLLPAAVKGLLTPANVSNLISGGLTTAGSLLQQQASKEAALAAQQRIDAETAAAKKAAQFRPVGMTTRFGTSQFGFDPITGQMTSAGYTLDPQAKNDQDRLVKLAESGLQQAEGAQAQYAPLQTGAQSLFNLGNQYISQSPQSVAQNYLKQQMDLLQPGRETELANLQTKLRNQGRMGLSVSQGGNLGATTPELQALYNARAQQEAVLAANAQQAGQQQVLYGAGLLGQGANAMGSYYGGQQQAYTPYTTALGGVQNLETLGQQPFNMSAALGQQTSLSGARAGQLGLTGAQLSTNLATSANATANPYAQALMAAGNPNAMFGQSLNNVFSGLFGNTPQGSLTTGFTPNSIQAGEYGLPIDPNFSGPLYY